MEWEGTPFVLRDIFQFPGLPLDWWSKDYLFFFGNRLGGFIVILEEVNTLSKRTISKVLINMHVQGGLYATINLVCGNKRHTEVINYSNLPLHCVHCHQVGHLFLGL